VAVVRIEGVILEGAIGYAKKQVEQAARDAHVKAVVLRINSPGGSITASDELHRKISALAKGGADCDGKPLLVSMGALAASGGYYIAMPAQKLYAERTTITGSIGVFASFPNVKKLTEKIGVEMEIVKDTGSPFKDSGSPFKDMSAAERQLWQDMVDHAYEQFLQVIRDGRPKIRDELARVVIDKPVTVAGARPDERYVRTRVDGGVFTAEQAERFGLIDRIGFLEEAITDAASVVGLGDDYRAITYDRPRSLTERLLGVQAPQPAAAFEPARLAEAATPRLWYLAPQSELAGLLRLVGP
jgi:protease-4